VSSAQSLRKDLAEDDDRGGGDEDSEKATGGAGGQGVEEDRCFGRRAFSVSKKWKARREGKGVRRVSFTTTLERRRVQRTKWRPWERSLRTFWASRRIEGGPEVARTMGRRKDVSVEHSKKQKITGGCEVLRAGRQRGIGQEEREGGREGYLADLLSQDLYARSRGRRPVSDTCEREEEGEREREREREREEETTTHPSIRERDR
jgi:hypothetical protein